MLACIPCGCISGLQAKQQRPPADADLAAQLQAVRQQLDAEQVARAAAEGKLDFLKSKVRDVAERSKSRGNMLAQLTLAVRKLADAKQQLQDAEGDLQQALAAAEAFLQVGAILLERHRRKATCRRAAGLR